MKVTCLAVSNKKPLPFFCLLFKQKRVRYIKDRKLSLKFKSCLKQRMSPGAAVASLSILITHPHYERLLSHFQFNLNHFKIKGAKGVLVPNLRKNTSTKYEWLEELFPKCFKI